MFPLCLGHLCSSVTEKILSLGTYFKGMSFSSDVHLFLVPIFSVLKKNKKQNPKHQHCGRAIYLVLRAHSSTVHLETADISLSESGCKISDVEHIQLLHTAWKLAADWLAGQEGNEWAVESGKVWAGCEWDCRKENATLLCRTTELRLSTKAASPSTSQWVKVPPPPCCFWKSAMPLLAGTTHRF